MSENKRVSLFRNANYSLLNGFFWMSVCVFVTFISAYLLDRGYSNTEIGVIMSAGLLCGMLFQPIVASIADRSKKYGATLILIVCFAVWLAAAILTLVLKTRSTLLTIVYILNVAMYMTVSPLISAYSAFLSCNGVTVVFGFARGCGSICYAISSAVLGVLVVSYGVQVVPVAGLITITGMIIVMLIFLAKAPQREVVAATAETAPQTSIFALFRNHPTFIFFLLASACITFGHTVENNFMLQVVTALGGDSEKMGNLMSYAALIEMPLMFFFARINKKINGVTLLKISAVSFLIKHTLILLSNSVPMLYVAHIFHIFGMGLFIPASVHFVNQYLDPGMLNRGQAMVGVTSTAGCIIASALGGYLIDSITVKGALVVCVAVTAVGTALMCFGLRREKGVS